MRRRVLPLLSALSLLLLALTLAVWVLSYVRPVGEMTVHRWYADNTPAGVEGRTWVAVDGILYHFRFTAEPRRQSTARQIDRPYRWYGKRLLSLQYRETFLGFSFVSERAGRAAQWSLPCAVPAILFAILPLWRRRLLAGFLKFVAIAVMLVLFARFYSSYQFDEWGYMLRVVLPLVLVASSVATLARQAVKKRRVFPVNCCRFCGYNLTGNVSGVCPECERKIEEPAPSRHN